MVCKMAEINSAASPDIRAYFMDPSLLAADMFKKQAKITGFQKEQAKNFQLLMTRFVRE